MSDVTAYQVSEQLQDNDKEHKATARNSALQPPLIQALQKMLVSSSFYVGHVAIWVTAVLPLSCLHLLYVRSFETEQGLIYNHQEMLTKDAAETTGAVGEAPHL